MPVHTIAGCNAPRLALWFLWLVSASPPSCPSFLDGQVRVCAYDEPDACPGPAKHERGPGPGEPGRGILHGDPSAASHGPRRHSWLERRAQVARHLLPALRCQALGRLLEGNALHRDRGPETAVQSEIIAESRDRVFLVMCWILRMIGARRTAGGIREQSPHHLADLPGALGWHVRVRERLQASPPFPFPFAQAVALLLHLNALVAPLTLAKWAGPVWLVGVMSFMAVFSAYLLNEVAREIRSRSPRPDDLPLLPVPAPVQRAPRNGLPSRACSPLRLPCFSQIAPEPKMRGLVASYRPSHPPSRR